MKTEDTKQEKFKYFCLSCGYEWYQQNRTSVIACPKCSYPDVRYPFVPVFINIDERGVIELNSIESIQYAPYYNISEKTDDIIIKIILKRGDKLQFLVDKDYATKFKENFKKLRRVIDIGKEVTNEYI
jgi:hypothetical protein